MTQEEYYLKEREVKALERIADVLEKWSRPSGYFTTNTDKPY